MSKINIDVPEHIHQMLKIISAVNSKSVKGIVLETLMEKIISLVDQDSNLKNLKIFENLGIIETDNIKEDDNEILTIKPDVQDFLK